MKVFIKKAERINKKYVLRQIIRMKTSGNYKTEILSSFDLKNLRKQYEQSYTICRFGTFIISNHFLYYTQKKILIDIDKRVIYCDRDFDISKI